MKLVRLVVVTALAYLLIPPLPGAAMPSLLSECGNGVCEEDEDRDNCPIDCGYCGDGMCAPPETERSCPEDCAHVGPPLDPEPSALGNPLTLAQLLLCEDATLALDPAPITLHDPAPDCRSCSLWVSEWNGGLRNRYRCQQIARDCSACPERIDADKCQDIHRVCSMLAALCFEPTLLTPSCK